MSQSLAAAITKTASRQTYYTIAFLVDRPRVEDAYCAYAYFRWVDDVLDAEEPSGFGWGLAERLERTHFLDRQRSLLDRCLRGESAQDTNDHEAMLVHLVRHAHDPETGLEAYLRNMMAVMEFDVRRRGLLVSQAELDDYTRSLAIAVTEAMHHFIGHGSSVPHDETRYMAASGAHILHMLRDTYTDLRAGYFNVPREVLEAHSIVPDDVDSEPYRAWVESRTRLARENLDAGRSYFSRVGSARHRLAGLAYIARFEWLIDTLEGEAFRLRPDYGERNSLTTGLRLGLHLLPWVMGIRGDRSTWPPVARRHGSRP